MISWRTMHATLHKAANGHLTLSLNDMPESSWTSLSERLVRSYGFRRTGSAVTGINEHIHQNFESSELKLAAGWANWSGHYLLSESIAGDAFLQKLFSELEPA